MGMVVLKRVQRDHLVLEVCQAVRDQMGHKDHRAHLVRRDQEGIQIIFHYLELLVNTVVDPEISIISQPRITQDTRIKSKMTAISTTVI